MGGPIRAAAMDRSDDPGTPERLVARARQRRQEGRLRDAVLDCDAAIRAAPDFAEAWLERAFVMAAGGSMRRASDCYRQVLALDPANGDAHAGLAGIAAREGDRAAARSHAEAALVVDPDNAIAQCALAAIDLEEGQAALARARLEPLVAALDRRGAEPAGERLEALTLLGDACARLGDAAAAFDAFRRSKQEFAALHASQFAGRPPHRDFLTGILAQIPSLHWPSLPATAEPRGDACLPAGLPAFGHDLAENVLASHPSVVALEERPTLRAADRAFLADPDGLARFAALPEAELDPFRADYWEGVAKAGIAVCGKCFVDMDPLKASRLPLIARLFPAARIVIMRRDPRDVVWSCFRTSFALTNMAMDLTTLEGAARHYDAMMRLTEAALARFSLAAHVVPYHRLVADFDTTTRELCDFLGLEWSATLREFVQTARQRGVATASAGQVRKGLYDGTRQWGPYAEWLAPVMPILQPWINKFGYAS